MKMVISVRSTQPRHEIAPDRLDAVLAASAKAVLDTGWQLDAVFDASLGAQIERLRRVLAVVPASRTRVWGRDHDDPDRVSSEATTLRSVRWQRCVAELQPDAVIDVCFGTDACAHDILARQLPLVAAMGEFAAQTGVGLSLRASSSEALAEALTTCAQQATSVPEPRPRAGVTDGPLRVDDQVPVRRSKRGNRVHRVPASGAALDRSLRELLREGGHAVGQLPGMDAIQTALSLETTLRLAHAAGGYERLRDVLRGASLQPADIDACLRASARGGRMSSNDDPWYAVRRALDAQLERMCAPDAPPACDVALRAEVLGPVAGPARFLIDISALAKFDAKSGIQRVVRNVLRHLERGLSGRAQIVPIAFRDDGRCQLASRFYARFMGLPYDLPDDEDFVPRPGDTFIGLDLSAHIVPEHPAQFVWLRRLGIPIHFVVYDLLPLQRPECFDPRVVDLFRSWYGSVADLADRVLCISRAVADEFLEWLDEYAPDREAPVEVGYFHLGADIETGTVEPGAHPLDGRRYALMVSTLEPRKGYVQALDAFEQLWADGDDLALVIVGKQGWLMETLVERMRAHSELGHRLHWFAGIGDDTLATLYGHAQFLLSASEGEGFGLPLIEASQYGVPVVCRDLPVFREIAGDAAFYFNGYEPEALADALRAWQAGGDARTDGRIAWKTWQAASEEFIAALMSPRPYRRWTRRAERRVFSSYNPRLLTAVGERLRGEIVSTGQAGVLLHGPYETVPAGRYRVRVFGDLDAGQLEAVKLDIVADRGREVIAGWSLAASGAGVLSDSLFDLRHDVDDLEVRVAVDASHRIRVSKLELVVHEMPTLDEHN